MRLVLELGVKTAPRNTAPLLKRARAAPSTSPNLRQHGLSAEFPRYSTWKTNVYMLIEI